MSNADSFQELNIDDQYKKGVVYTFGRFNPFTKGHNNLVNTIKKTAEKLEKQSTIKYDKLIFVSNPKPPPLPNLKTIQKIKKSAKFTPSNLNRNPFNVYEKVYWMEKIAPKDVEIINTATKNIKNWDDAFNWLKSEGYKDIHMVIGSDRYNQFKSNTKKLKSWNKEKDINFSLVESKRLEDNPKKLYKGFEKLTKKEKETIKNIYSDKEISATRMRAAAASHVPGKNDIGKKIFRIGVGPKLSDKNVEQLITALKKKMHLNPNKSYIDTVNEGVSKNTRSKVKKSKKNTTKKKPSLRRSSRLKYKVSPKKSPPKKSPSKKTTKKSPSKKTTKKSPSKKTSKKSPSKKTTRKATSVRKSSRLKNKTKKNYKNNLSVIVE